MADCEHLQGVTAADFPPGVDTGACEDCLVEGTTWVALRECRDCGHVGCCNSSPGRHATGHYESSNHPVIRSVMPGESWTWCYVHELMGELPG